MENYFVSQISTKKFQVRANSVILSYAVNMDNDELPPTVLSDITRTQRMRRLRLIFFGSLIFAGGVVLGAWITYEPIHVILEVPAAERPGSTAPDDTINT